MDDRAFLGRGWAFPVAAASDGGEVAMAEYEEDVRQAILIILETNRGERVMRPDFGAGLEDFVFEPRGATTRALVKQRVEEALTRWEPRIDLREVTVTDEAELGLLAIRIAYEVRRTNTFYNLVYPFYLQEQRP